MKEDRIKPSDLKVGDVVCTKEPTRIGWGIFRYPRTSRGKIKRITPKRTKVILEDGREFYTREKTFYRITDDSIRQDAIAHCALDIFSLTNRFERELNTTVLNNLSDEDISSISRHLREIDFILHREDENNECD